MRRAFSLTRVATPRIPTSYTAVDLGPAEATDWPSSINNRGDVVGMFWPNGQIQTEPSNDGTWDERAARNVTVGEAMKHALIRVWVSEQGKRS